MDQYLLLVPIYVQRERRKNYTGSYGGAMLKNRFHFRFRMGAKHNSFSQFHVRKNYASHPSDLIRMVKLQNI